MPLVELVNAAFALGRREVLRGITATVDGGELIAVIGANGAGKTTLLRGIAGLIRPPAGTVAVAGHDPAVAARRTIARVLAYLPQRYELAFPFAVEEVVLLGRYASTRGLAIANSEDLAAARAAMTECDVAHLATRRFDELSGGEARRVVLAQALCQGARCLLLDEPTAGLDPLHAHRLFELLAARAAGGLATIVATHDLDLALRHATAMWLVADGTIAARGSASEVLTGDATRRAFGIAIHVGMLPSGERFAVAAR